MWRGLVTEGTWYLAETVSGPEGPACQEVGPPQESLPGRLVLDLTFILKKNRKLPKVVSKGKAHICVLERPPWLQQGATELEGTRRDGTGNGYGNDGSVS